MHSPCFAIKRACVIFKMDSIKVADFSLKHTIECGQLFRWLRKDGDYYVIINNTVLKLKQDGEHLYYSANRRIPASFLRSYFRLNEDYQSIIQHIAKDSLMKKAIRMFHGLRLIQQEPRECLLSYVCSSFSNIPKIQGNLNKMALCFGKPVLFDNHTFFTFPLELGNLEKIRNCGVGYRASYLFEVSRKATHQFLNPLRKLPYEEAKRALMQLHGVGDKVADCVLLFSLGFSEAFPVDTWIRRGFSKAYLGGTQASGKEVREYAARYFGRHAGYAQQFLFHYWRTTKAYI